MALNFHSVSVVKRYTGHEIQILPFLWSEVTLASNRLNWKKIGFKMNFVSSYSNNEKRRVQ